MNNFKRATSYDFSSIMYADEKKTCLRLLLKLKHYARNIIFLGHFLINKMYILLDLIFLLPTPSEK